MTSKNVLTLAFASAMALGAVGAVASAQTAPAIQTAQNNAAPATPAQGNTAPGTPAAGSAVPDNAAANAGGRNGTDSAEYAAVAGLKLSLADAAAAAEKQFGGKAVNASLDNERQANLYEVELLTDAGSKTVSVDGQTGAAQEVANADGGQDNQDGNDGGRDHGDHHRGDHGGDHGRGHDGDHENNGENDSQEG